MKFRLICLIYAASIATQACSTFGTIQVDTLRPSQIDIPGGCNKIVYTNLAKPERYVGISDSSLYDIVLEETTLGFLNAIKNAEGVDTTIFYYKKGSLKELESFLSEKVTWNSLKDFVNDKDADIIVSLNSFNFDLYTTTNTRWYYDTVLFLKYRVLAIDAKWSVFNIKEKKKLDQFKYIDTLYWESSAITDERASNKLPDFERVIREACYFAATDYANRIFPNWKTEKRYYYLHGNKDFKLAAKYVKNNNWDEASKLWKKYSINKDIELASRACFNMALESELKGDLNLAVVWAEKSLSLKEKGKTKDYIETLRTRLNGIKKLEKQIYY